MVLARPIATSTAASQGPSDRVARTRRLAVNRHALRPDFHMSFVSAGTDRYSANGFRPCSSIRSAPYRIGRRSTPDAEDNESCDSINFPSLGHSTQSQDRLRPSNLRYLAPQGNALTDSLNYAATLRLRRVSRRFSPNAD